MVSMPNDQWHLNYGDTLIAVTTTFLYQFTASVFVNTGFWMDIGQPKDFIIGMGLYLSFLHDNFPDKLEQGENFVGSVLVVSNRNFDCYQFQFTNFSACLLVQPSLSLSLSTCLFSLSLL